MDSCPWCHTAMNPKPKGQEFKGEENDDEETTAVCHLEVILDYGLCKLRSASTRTQYMTPSELGLPQPLDDQTTQLGRWYAQSLNWADPGGHDDGAPIILWEQAEIDRFKAALVAWMNDANTALPRHLVLDAHPASVCGLLEKEEAGVQAWKAKGNTPPTFKGYPWRT